MAMELQTLQYQMWLAVKKHQALIGRRQEEPHNLAIQKEILEVLCQLVSINETQKLVVTRLREERENDRDKMGKKCPAERDKEDIDLLCKEQMIHEAPDTEGRLSGMGECRTQPCKSPSCSLDPLETTPPYAEFMDDRQQQKSSREDCYEDLPIYSGEGEDGNEGEESGSLGSWWCSPEKRLHNFQPPTADYTIEDIHDLVTAEEFMHAIGLLTVRECEEVMAKRTERRKRNAYSHVFSNTIWEKPETRRKRRAWLMSGAGSPPVLRRKASQTPSQPQSRPGSPAQSSCSPPTTCPPSQPASPQSVDEFPVSQPSEEVCPMCKMKGADVECDGCGVIYHGQCVDLGDREPPLRWLCLTCEQLGLRSSNIFDPQLDCRRREALEVRERLLRQRAELTVAKLQLEERKQHLAVALQEQCSERQKLEDRENEVRKSIHQLQSFIFTFQRPDPPQATSLSPTSTSSTVHWPESASAPSPPTSALAHHFPSDLTVSRSSSPSNPSSRASSPCRTITNSFLPGLTISSVSSPCPSTASRILPNLTITWNSASSPGHPSHSMLSGQSVSCSSSPSHVSSQASSPSHVSPHGNFPSVTVSPSCSPKHSYLTSPRHNSGDVTQSEVMIHALSKPSMGKILCNSEWRNIEHSSGPSFQDDDDNDIDLQPTDLSIKSHSRQNGLPGRIESEAMAASF